MRRRLLVLGAAILAACLFARLALCHYREMERRLDYYEEHLEEIQRLLRDLKAKR